MKPSLSVLVLVLGALLGASHDACAGADRAARASALFASAQKRLALGSHEQRQFALQELENAAALDPARSDIALALGTLYLESDLLSRARDVAHQLTVRDSANAAAWLLEGKVWRRYWLGTIDDIARDRAILSLARSARLAPGGPSAWRLLAPLLIDAEEFEPAYAAAAFAARATPRDANAQVLLAAAAQRVGRLGEAERLFQQAVPRLAASDRERYDDIMPLLSPPAAARFTALRGTTRAEYVERFWLDTDPDLVSSENEARLEYWARVTQALALYGTSRPGEWDLRAQYYVRFGRPGWEEINPIMKPASMRQGDWMTWTYPELGLRLWMGSPSVSFGFSSPLNGRMSMARAFPDSLARRGELVPLGGGWAVLHRVPPGVSPVETRVALSRFQSDGGAVHLFAQVEAPGTPEDHMTAEWAVFDSTYAPRMRGDASMSASACRADQARAASFTAPLTPGTYWVGVQVSDTLGHRGAVRRRVVVDEGSSALALSDLVVVCGSPAQSVAGGSSVRLEPETGLFPEGGDQLHAYFEIYNLMRTPSGEAGFVYECSVAPVIRDRRGWLSQLLAPHTGPPPIVVSRAETTVGAMRRQFLSMQVGSLPPGTYEVSVLVRDATSGASARSVATFERGR